MNDLKLIVMDIDGTLTDGKIYYSDNGNKLKSFNVKDGLGIGRLISSGINVIWITGREDKCSIYRAEELGIKEVYVGVKDKKQTLDNVLENHQLCYSMVGYIGDDLNDLEAMKCCKYKFAVKNACDQILEIADYVSEHEGGNGAVRDIIDYIMSIN
jgi:3-deoxy-D-manno-octulosonate 8-phosphate phosphatase (KDO 8-P phosphatase)